MTQQQPIPVFWSQDLQLGGALCHCAGHSQRARFEKQARLVNDKSRNGALLEFAFVKHDEKLKMNMKFVPNVAVATRNQPRRG